MNGALKGYPVLVPESVVFSVRPSGVSEYGDSAQVPIIDFVILIVSIETSKRRKTPGLWEGNVGRLVLFVRNLG